MHCEKNKELQVNLDFGILKPTVTMNFSYNHLISSRSRFCYFNILKDMDYQTKISCPVIPNSFILSPTCFKDLFSLT